VLFDQDCRLLYRVFAYTLIKKVRNYFVFVFQYFSQSRSWEIEISCKFCHIRTIFVKGVRKERLGLNSPRLEFDILQKLYYLRKGDLLVFAYFLLVSLLT